MGIRFYCPQGHKLNVKSFLAGKKGFCPHCNAKVDIPLRSTRPSSKEDKQKIVPSVMAVPVAGPAGKEGAAAPLDAPLAKPVSSPTHGAPMALPVSPQTSNLPGHPVSGPAVFGPSPPGPSAGTPVQAHTAKPLTPLKVPTNMPSPGTATTQPNAPTNPPGMPASATASATKAAEQKGHHVTAGSAAAPTSDPIAEAPHAVWYVRPSLGGQYGPASGDMLRQWIQQGRVAADSLVWRDGWPSWQPAGTVLPQTTAPSASASVPNTADLGLPMSLQPLPVSAREGLGKTTPRKRSNLVVTTIVALLVVIALALAGVLVAMLN